MELVASKTKALDLLAVGDSHIRPLTMLPSEQVRAVPISGATMSGALNPASKTQARSTICLLYTSPSPRDATLSRMPSSA